MNDGQPGGITSEDLIRSTDRRQVLEARRDGRLGRLAWLLVGPGVLAMLGENDGPSMLSYAASGASYGIGFFLPFILLTFAAAYIVQEMAMRVGAVTHRGYGQLVFQRFGPFWGWFSATDLVVTNLVTLVTEIIAIRLGMGFFGVAPPVAVGCAVLLVVVSSLGGRYSRWERIGMGLAVFNLLFVAVACLARPSPGAIVHALLTWTPLHAGDSRLFLLLLASDIGATVTPWMLFFQQSASADKGMTPRDIQNGRIDTAAGTILAAVAGCAALLCATPLFLRHIDVASIDGGAGYALALGPVIGKFGAGLFALGLVEAGAVAMLTVSASTAYAVGEIAGGTGHSFNRSLRDAPLFHLVNVGISVLASLIVLIPGAPLLAISLNANLLATILMPPALVFLLIMASDKQIMGPHANSKRLNAIGIGIAALVAVAGGAYAFVAFAAAITGRS